MKNSKAKIFGWAVSLLIVGVIGFYFVGRRGDREKLIAEQKRVTQDPSAKASTGDPEAVVPLVTLQDTKLPPIPFLLNWCEGDECENSTLNTIVCNADLHQNANLHSKLVGALKPGQVIKGRTLFTKVLKLGSYRIDADHLGVLLADSGEGNWNTFQDGKWDVVDLDSKEKLDARVVSYPENEAWALVELEDGSTGFVEKFNGPDGRSCPFASPQ